MTSAATDNRSRTRASARRSQARTPPPQTGKRLDIQGLRAVAVLLVIADHAGIPGFSGGYVGVDVFFVISGFVITQLLLRETGKALRDGLADFYARRVRRIAPAATATLIFTLLAAAIFIGSRMNPHLPGDVRWASLFGTNFRLIDTGSNYFVPGLQPSFITQFWSLAVEEQFYLVYPLIVFGVYRLAPPRLRLRVLTVVVAAGVLASAIWSIHLTSANPPHAYYSPFTRFWELGLGCLLALLTADRARHSIVRRPGAQTTSRSAGRTQTVHAGRLLTTFGVLLLVISLLVLNGHSAYPGVLAWFPCLAAMFILWGGTHRSTTGFTALLSSRPLVYIGDLSYSLYLTHYVWLNLPGQMDPPLNGWGWRIPELIGTAVTAMASYYLLENPIRHSRRLAGDRVSVGLVLCVCIVAAWGVSIVIGHIA